jgi:hypothetical protein
MIDLMPGSKRFASILRLETADYASRITGPASGDRQLLLSPQRTLEFLRVFEMLGNNRAQVGQ